MWKNGSLRNKTVAMLLFLVLLATVPLVLYYLEAAEVLAQLGTDPAIEQSLARAMEIQVEPDAKQVAADALQRYRQIKVLKRTIIVREILLFSILYSAAVVVVALGVGFVFASRIARPLRNLTEATRKLAADQLDTRIDESAGGEIGQLERSFNKMADDLAVARQQRAIAERRATWQRVARTIAHEIKNPLTPIKLSTERMYDKFLNQSPDFPDVIKSTSNTILTEIANLQKLVDTFHRYAKFPDPVLKVESIPQIVKEVVDLHQSGDYGVSCRVDPDLSALEVDKGQMKEALTNLIKNGIEAAQAVPRKPEIALVAAKQNRAIAISVTDNGYGISAENQKKLFQPYFTTKKHGNGIGLALTERIVSLNGGKITFESREGTGTTFTIIFHTENT